MDNISIVLFLLNLLRKDEEEIDGVRKKKPNNSLQNHLTVNRTFSTINDVSI